jgi:hypothetical protein
LAVYLPRPTRLLLHTQARDIPDFPPSTFLDGRGMLLAVVEPPLGASLMEWVTPQHEEIDLNCEISSYANAEL